MSQKLKLGKTGFVFCNSLQIHVRFHTDNTMPKNLLLVPLSLLSTT